MELPKMLATVAQRGAALQSLGSMCDDCAFKEQPDINGYGEAVKAAASCLVLNGTFHCHTSAYEDAGVICTGFAYARQYFANLDKQAYEQKGDAERPAGPITAATADF